MKHSYLQKIVFVITFYVLFINNSIGQDASDWQTIHTKGKQALANFPSVDQINRSKLTARLKKVLLDTRKELTVIASNRMKPNNAIYTRSINKINDFPTDFHKNVVVMFQDNGGGGGTTSISCKDKYDNCMEAHNCTHSTLCICCIPCSIEYMGCIKDILTSPGPRSGRRPKLEHKPTDIKVN